MLLKRQPTVDSEKIQTSISRLTLFKEHPFSSVASKAKTERCGNAFPHHYRTRKPPSDHSKSCCINAPEGAIAGKIDMRSDMSRAIVVGPSNLCDLLLFLNLANDLLPITVFHLPRSHLSNSRAGVLFCVISSRQMPLTSFNVTAIAHDDQKMVRQLMHEVSRTTPY